MAQRVRVHVRKFCNSGVGWSIVVGVCCVRFCGRGCGCGCGCGGGGCKIEE